MKPKLSAVSSEVMSSTVQLAMSWPEDIHCFKSFSLVVPLASQAFTIS